MHKARGARSPLQSPGAMPLECLLMFLHFIILFFTNGNTVGQQKQLFVKTGKTIKRIY